MKEIIKELQRLNSNIEEFNQIYLCVNDLDLEAVKRRTRFTEMKDG